MTLTDVLRRSEKLIIDNSPLILTTVGAVGTVATAWYTGKATFKAAQIIEDELFRQKMHPGDNGKAPEVTKTEAVKLVWKVYILPAGICTGSVGAIVMANHINTKRLAGLAAAYTISEKMHDEYKDKIVEKFGKNKEQAARDQLAQERTDRTPLDRNLVVGDGDVLCFDQFTGRYFTSTVEKLRKAENDINYKILTHGYASLSDFYEEIGLAPTSYSEEAGWNDKKRLSLLFSTTMSTDGRPCVSVDMDAMPIRMTAICP